MWCCHLVEFDICGLLPLDRTTEVLAILRANVWVLFFVCVFFGRRGVWVCPHASEIPIILFLLNHHPPVCPSVRASQMGYASPSPSPLKKKKKKKEAHTHTHMQTAADKI